MPKERLLTLRSIPMVLYRSARQWVEDRALRLGAGVAYYSLFALVPILVLAVSFASIFVGQEQVIAEVREAITELMGSDAADAIIEILQQTDIGGDNIVLTLAGLGVLLFTATLLFVAWKEVVDILWGIPRQWGVRASARRRGFGVAAVLGAGVLLTVVLIAETVVAALGNWFSTAAFDWLLTLTGSFVPSVLGALFIAVLFRYTPDVEVAWRSVWLGAIVSMVLLVIGAWAYGVYLDRFGFQSAAGGVAVAT